MPDNVEAAADWLRAGTGPAAHSLDLQLHGLSLRIRCGNAVLLAELRDYFRPVCGHSDAEGVSIEVYDCAPPQTQPRWRDWPREAGKSGRKDAYLDLPGGRLILKVRTGMVFLQSEHALVVRGPCSEHPNQIINFVNAQYMNFLQQQGWLLCHAAAVDINGYGIVVAGLSGGGKSTLMLRLMEYPGACFVSNDRLLLRRRGDEVEALGIPKMPRINPGTLVHNPRLEQLLPTQRREELLAMPPAELWNLEEKHDVIIESAYGMDRVRFATRAETLIVLNWSGESKQPVSIRERSDGLGAGLAAAVMKSPGPFYQLADGTPYPESASLQTDDYLRVFEPAEVLEVIGCIDFDRVAEQLFERIDQRIQQRGHET